MVFAVERTTCSLSWRFAYRVFRRAAFGRWKASSLWVCFKEADIPEEGETKHDAENGMILLILDKNLNLC